MTSELGVQLYSYYFELAISKRVYNIGFKKLLSFGFCFKKLSCLICNVSHVIIQELPETING